MAEYVLHERIILKMKILNIGGVHVSFLKLQPMLILKDVIALGSKEAIRGVFYIVFHCCCLYSLFFHYFHCIYCIYSNW